MMQLEKFEKNLDKYQITPQQRQLWLQGFKFLPPESIESFLEVVASLSNEEFGKYSSILENQFKQATK